MSELPASDDYLDLFLNDRAMMDVRAPVEFVKGAFPNTVNAPLLDDSQREAVGKRYKDAGQDEAIRLGLELITPAIRQQRLQQWSEFARYNPDGFLYCFRGGLRSRTTQQWLHDAGIDIPLIRGGYKAMRQFLLQQLEISQDQVPLVILAGLTGSGKTHVLKKIEHHVDLEGLANHRGSAFGRDVNDFQPTQINFENELSIALLKHRHRHPTKAVMLEDEGKLIGRVYLPPPFYQNMVNAPRVFLERPLQDRIRMTSDDYFGLAWPIYQQTHGDAARDRFAAFALESLGRIRKRLGGVRYKQVHEIFLAALERIFDTGSAEGFDEGVRILLEDYYDPMYRYQLEQKPVEVIFSGTETDILAWAEANLQEDFVDDENTVPGSPRQVVVG